MGRRRLLVGYGFLALLFAGVLGGLAVVGGALGERSPCTAPAAERDPVQAATRFVETAVERVHVERSYGLVTPTLREDLSCADWMTGSIPVQPFLSIAWPQAGFRVVQQSEGRVVLLVALRSRNIEWPPSTFYLELLSTDGRWLANGWVPAGTGPVPAAFG
jgi:hypothetical protein